MDDFERPGFPQTICRVSVTADRDNRYLPKWTSVCRNEAPNQEHRAAGGNEATNRPAIMGAPFRTALLAAWQTTVTVSNDPERTKRNRCEGKVGAAIQDLLCCVLERSRIVQTGFVGGGAIRENVRHPKTGTH